jgi:Zn-dependent metalloprotease
MKRILLLLLTIAALSVSAKNDKQLPASFKLKLKEFQYNDRSNFPSFMVFEKGQQLKVDKTSSTWAKNIFDLNGKDELHFQSEKSEVLNNTAYHHYTFQQYYAQTPVEFAIIKVHEKAGEIEIINGDFHAGILPINTPNISSEQALNISKSLMPAKYYKWEMNNLGQQKQANHAFEPNTHLVLLPLQVDGVTQFYYAYKSTIYTEMPLAIADIYIDANTGQQLKLINKLCTANSKGTAVTKYTGTKTITTDSLSAVQFELSQTNRGNSGTNIKTYNCQKQFENNAIAFTDSDNYWNNFNANLNEAATDAYYGAEQTFDFYKNIHNRNSIDDNGKSMEMYLHYDLNYFNAFWNGSYTVFGDGNGQPLTYIDVVGHEFSHGVTEFSAGLIYESESGALNESFSDIFGSAIEIYALDSNASWKIGRGNFSLRDMSNPNAFQNPDTYGGLNWTNTKNCIPSGGNDQCGVHNNSGVQNYWYYLLSDGAAGKNDIGNTFDVKGIGYLKASKIAYRNLTNYLSPSSDYNDARKGAIQSAIDLYGFGSQEYIATTDAWYAVGVGKKYTAIPTPDFYIEKLVCDLNTDMQFVNTTGTATSYLWDFGDAQTSVAENPMHAYTKSGKYTVTLIASNPNGADTLVKNNYVEVYTNQTKATSCAGVVADPLSNNSIYNVSLADLNNSSSNAVIEGGYVDFTCKRAIVEAGKTYPMTITTNSAGSVFTRVFIDFNNDAAFDTSEEVFKTDLTVKTHEGNITIPINAILNTPLRMRIRSGRASGNIPSDPCGTIKFGQIEDYSIVIKPATGIAMQHFQTISAYPNPATEVLNIANPLALQASCTLIDLFGKVVFEGALSSELTQIPTTNFAAGVYFLKIANNTGSQHIKIVLK